MNQYSLFREDPVYAEYIEIPLSKVNELIPDVNSIVVKPSASFIESVKLHGILSPIALVKKGDQYTLCYGRRRIVAAILTNQPTIPARVFPEQTNVESIFSLIENTNRKSNPLNEWIAVEDLLSNNLTTSEIFARTGLPKAKQNQLLIFRKLNKFFNNAFVNGSLKSSIAFMVAKQKPGVQGQLEEIYKNKGKITLKDISSLRLVSKKQQIAALPGSLFGDEYNDWESRAKSALESVKNQLKDIAPSDFIKKIDQLICFFD